MKAIPRPLRTLEATVPEDVVETTVQAIGAALPPADRDAVTAALRRQSHPRATADLIHGTQQRCYIALMWLPPRARQHAMARMVAALQALGHVDHLLTHAAPEPGAAIASALEADILAWQDSISRAASRHDRHGSRC